MKMKKQIRSKLNILILIVITMLVLYFSLKDNFTEVVHQLLTLNPWWFLVAVLFMVLYFIFRSFVMYCLVLHFHEKYTFKKAFKLVMSTQFFHAITPFASGGQPYEIYSLKKQGMRLSDATNVSIQNFIVFQIALVLLGAFAVISNSYFHFFKQITFLRFLTTLGFVINLAVIVGLFAITFGKRFNQFLLRYGIRFLAKIKVVKDKDKALQKWTSSLIDFHTGAKILLQNKKEFVGMIFFNLLSLMCSYSIPVFLLYSMGDYTSFTIFSSIVTCAYVMLIGNFVPIPGGTGGLEYSFIQFFGNFVTGPILNSIMLLWRFITYYLGMIIGAISFNMKDKR